ncbi:MAG: 16S rRNA (guanine(527)-N(7))-methyltransferase RsmG [Pseudomonadota bacterium]
MDPDNNQSRPMELLARAALEIGIDLSPAHLDKFAVYLTELKEWNEKLNLTALRNDRDIVIKHFVDSLSLCRFISGGSHVVDAGSGAGFPGIPLKIVNPSLFLLLVDAKRKKVHFLRYIIRTLELKDIDAIQAHLDHETSRTPEYCEKADVVVSRAFSDLRIFLDLCLNLLKPGGTAIAMKGPAVDKEIEKVAAGDRYAAYEKTADSEFTLPFTKDKRRVLVYRKSTGVRNQRDGRGPESIQGDLRSGDTSIDFQIMFLGRQQGGDSTCSYIPDR